MKATLITIGDEILIGQIVDTNSAFIAQKLNEIGIEIHEILSVHDCKAHILKALHQAEQQSDIVITTGGLGPTKDDITKQTFCTFFNDHLVLSEDVLKHIEQLFKKYIDTPISDLNRQQAMVPSQCKLLHNAHGTAPGMWFEKNGKVFISLPGVPYEMKALLTESVIPGLSNFFERPHIIHQTVLTAGLGESAIAERIADWEDALPTHIKLAYLPNLGKVRLRLSGKGSDPMQLQSEIDEQVARLLKLIPDIFVGFEGKDSLEINIARILTGNDQTLSVAESCTGGQLAATFTKHPGASVYFKGGLVAYQTVIKTSVLGVDQSLIDKYSVVSEEVAAQMAEKCRKLFKTDYAISTTGNAGPTRGDSNAEVGTVCIGLATPEAVYTQRFLFGKNRERVVGKAVNKSLEWLLKEISKK